MVMTLLQRNTAVESSTMRATGGVAASYRWRYEAQRWRCEAQQLDPAGGNF
jgi:hypothetical protein